MSAFAQQIVSGVIVLAAAGYATWSLWLRRRWRARQAAGGGAGGTAAAGAGCGCSGCDAAPVGKPARS